MMPQTKIEKTEKQWRQELTSEQFEITRQKGTEPAFSGAFWNTKTEGVYVCVCCGQPLYSSIAKYDSGSGWPSFWEPVNRKAVETNTDTSAGMVRTEAMCSCCGAHLGHIFSDGPRPTSQRHCINSASLQLIEGQSKT